MFATHEQLLKLAVPLMRKKRPGGGLDIMIVPANCLDRPGLSYQGQDFK